MKIEKINTKIKIKSRRFRIKFLNLLAGKRENKNSNKILKPESKLHIIYRISDKGYPKVKLSIINNENCLINALSCFPLNTVDWLILCDNCSKETMNMIHKYVPEENTLITNIGSGAGTFNFAYDKALTFNEDDIVYFLENDYLHLPDSLEILLDGFNLSNGENDYITLYDHPDKYDINHICYYYMKKHTHVFLGKKSHWKSAFSTTMTFAAKVSTLKKDKKIWKRWTKTSHPYDFEIFLDLNKKGRSLLSPIPGRSTHGEVEYLSPLVKWENIKF